MLIDMQTLIIIILVALILGIIIGISLVSPRYYR
jgi:hypothetical protein